MRFVRLYLLVLGLLSNLLARVITRRFDPTRVLSA